MILDTDHHVHSRYSDCCHENYDLETIINRQTENGMRYVCVSDHIHRIEDTGGLSEHLRFLRENPEIAAKNRVFVGAELTFIDYDGNIPLPFIDSKDQPDFLIAGCHSIPEYGINMGDIISAGTMLGSMNSDEFSVFTAGHHRMLKGAVLKGIINILAHPYDFFFRCEIFDSRLLENFIEIARICRKNDIAVEINNASARRCLSSAGNYKNFNKYCIQPAVFYMEMINIARNEGALFSTGSDAHDADSIGNMDYAEKVVTKINIDRTQLLNLDNGDDFRKYLPVS